MSTDAQKPDGPDADHSDGSTDSTAGGEKANQGPIPTDAENSADTGEGVPGDLTAEARDDRDD